MIENVVGRLTVRAIAGKDRKRNLLWLCECACGTETVVAGWRLRKGEPKSCGCLQREVTAKRNLSHGMAGTRLYRIWANMIARCCNERGTQYPDYGGRGISVCDQWKSFEPFAEWASANGYSHALSIDRVNNNGNYEPSNCRWATATEQSRNKRPRKDQKLTDTQIDAIRSDARPQNEIAEEYGVRQQYISRIKTGKRRSFPTGENRDA